MDMNKFGCAYTHGEASGDAESSTPRKLNEKLFQIDGLDEESPNKKYKEVDGFSFHSLLTRPFLSLRNFHLTFTLDSHLRVGFGQVFHFPFDWIAENPPAQSYN